MRVTILYLAAGNSRRFGENKLLYPLDGKAVYRHLLDRLAQIAGRHENWELLGKHDPFYFTISKRSNRFLKR